MGNHGYKEEIKSLKDQLKSLQKEMKMAGNNAMEQNGIISNLKKQVSEEKKETEIERRLKEEIQIKHEKLLQENFEFKHTAKLLTEKDESIRQLKAEIEAKNYDLDKGNEEKEELTSRYHKLLKDKSEELNREKSELSKLKNVMLKSSLSSPKVHEPKPLSEIQLLEKLDEKDVQIKKLERNLKEKLKKPALRRSRSYDHHDQENEMVKNLRPIRRTAKKGSIQGKQRCET